MARASEHDQYWHCEHCVCAWPLPNINRTWGGASHREKEKPCGFMGSSRAIAFGGQMSSPCLHSVYIAFCVPIPTPVPVRASLDPSVDPEVIWAFVNVSCY